MENKSPSRFAEIAVEIMGAKYVSEFLRDIWATASPEAKRELADAMLKQMGERITRGSLGVDAIIDGVLHGEIKRIVGEAVAGRQEEFENATRSRIEAGILRAHESVERMVATHATGMFADRYSEELRRRLQDAVHHMMVRGQ